MKLKYFIRKIGGFCMNFKKCVSILLASMLVCATLVGCKQTSATNTSGNSSASKSAKSYTIAMLPKFKGENYFDGCYQGAKKAAADLGITLVYDGPSQSQANNTTQVQILNGFIARKVDAIIVSPMDPIAIAPTLLAAKAAGIKVVTFDSDARVDARDIYVDAATPFDIAEGLIKYSIVPDLQAKGFGPNKKARLALISGSGLDANTNAWVKEVGDYIKTGENGAYSWITLKADSTGYKGGDIWTPGSDETAAQNAASQAMALAGGASDGSKINAIIGMSSMSGPALGAAYDSIAGTKPDVVLAGIATPLGMKSYIVDSKNPEKHGVLWDVGNLGYLSVEVTVSLLKGNLDLNSATYKSTLGDKTIVTNDVTVNGKSYKAKQIELGRALVFDTTNVANFNF
jgi:rhamnose transport system substrate-binding protein